MTTERWVRIDGFANYEISDTGRVRRDGKVKAISINRHGYCDVSLWSNGKRSKRLIAPLVAGAFIGPRPTGLVVCHEDGIRTNNSAKNLRWDTRSANEQDKRKHGTARVLDRHLDAKLNLELVLQLRARYRPLCRLNGIKALAREYGLSPTAMRRALNGTNWRQL